MSAKNMRSKIPVKVVIINTQYIETDARSFKSIVQSLTGKNSNVAPEAMSPPPMAASYCGSGNGTSVYWEDQNVGGGSSPSLGRLKSFNEFDKLFSPSLDDLIRIYEEIQQ